jgi:amylosucrase
MTLAARLGGAALEQAARDRLGPAEADAFVARLEQLSFDITEPLEQVYGAAAGDGEGGSEGGSGLIASLIMDALDVAARRPAALRMLDRRREIDPAWFQRSRMIGYACYADRFAGSLAGLRGRLDYLAELGVSYLHLMPLLQPRAGDSDGGYAVADYDAVDPRLGTMAELQELAADLHTRGMALCIDLVLNHTAAEHPWARQAQVCVRPAWTCTSSADWTELDGVRAHLPEVFP